MQFAMGHFQTKKPPYKAGREFRRWRVSPAGHWRIARYEKVSGFFEAVWENHFQQKKFAYGVDCANSRRGRLPSTR